MQTLALPTLPFDEFLQYTPSWQEVASFGGVIAYGVIVYSLSYRYLPLFPSQGKDVTMFPGIDGFHWSFGHVLFLSSIFRRGADDPGDGRILGMARFADFRNHRASICGGLGIRGITLGGSALPPRTCGKSISRTCDNGFDCRRCDKYSHFAVLPAPSNGVYCGLNSPARRYITEGTLGWNRRKTATVYSRTG